MMNDKVEIKRVFQGNRTDVFNYFTDPVLLEQWSYPDGMTLKVPFMEKRIGGEYRNEHKSKDGSIYVCNGKFLDFDFNKKLVMEEEVFNPLGDKVMYGMIIEISFSDDPNGCLVEIKHEGFNHSREVSGCKQAWEQCLNRLDSIFQPTTSVSL